LEELLYRNYRFEDVRDMKPIQFPKSRWINAPNSNFITK
jgi:hypothetical protein